MTMIQRFWAKVDKNGPIQQHCVELGQCWVWTAAKQKFGHGVKHRIIAERFGLDRSTITAINLGKNWPNPRVIVTLEATEA